MGRAIAFTVGIFLGLVIFILVIGISFGKRSEPADSTKTKENRKYDTKANKNNNSNKNK